MLTGSVTGMIDLRGKTITTFIAFELHRALEPLEVGDRITVVTDAAPAIETDMQSWTRIRGHRLVSLEQIGDRFTFEVEKGASTTPPRAVAVVISTEAMLELLSPLAFALGAALEGHQVSLYFQGPGIRVLSSGYRPHLSGWSRPFTRFARKGIEVAGHIAPHDKLRQLLELGARVYACGPSMDRFGVAPDQLAFPDITIAEYLTFVDVMVNADAQFYV